MCHAIPVMHTGLPCLYVAALPETDLFCLEHSRKGTTSGKHIDRYVRKNSELSIKASSPLLDLSKFVHGEIVRRWFEDTVIGERRRVLGSLMARSSVLTMYH